VSRTIKGKVVEVDSVGNLVTDIGAEQLTTVPRDETVRIIVDEHETIGIFPVEHGQPSMTLVAILSNSGPLRIELIDDSATAMLGVRVGAPVEVVW
jgi:S-adenosylmethionine hydrolase